MKNNFDRTKTATARFSTRAVAMMLFFVMLLTAIGSGSVLSAIAADFDTVSGDAIPAAATEGSDIALNAIPEAVEEPDNADEAVSAPDLSGFEENEIVRKMKDDLAPTGNGTYPEIFFIVPKDWTVNGYSVKVSAQLGENGSYTADFDAYDTGDTYQGYRMYHAYPYEQYWGWGHVYVKAYSSGTQVDYFDINNVGWKGMDDMKGKCAYFAASGNSPDWAEKKTDDHYYLSGYLGKKGAASSNNVNASSPDYEMTKGTGDNSNKWTYTYLANGDQYLTINMHNDWGSRALHPESDNAVSGATATGNVDTSYSGSGNYKWQIQAAAGQRVTVTYDTWTRQVSWVVTTPGYKIKYGSTDTGRNTTVNLVKNASNKYVTSSDITISGNFFFDVLDDTDGIVWSSKEAVNVVVENQYLSVEKKENNSTTPKYFALVMPKGLGSGLPYSFSFDPDDSNKMTITANATFYNLTAGGDNTKYSLRISDGKTSVSNVSGTTTGSYLKDKNVTVTIRPLDSSKKVQSISDGTTTISTITSNHDGTYTATYPVSADNKTLFATLVDKSQVAVNFTSNDVSKGTVSAKTAAGVVLNNGDTVLEDTKVIFSASPTEGNAFTDWTGGFTGEDNPITKTISQATSVVGNFAAEGYQIHYKDGTAAVSMKELPDGRFITTSAVTKDKLFTIKRTANNKYLYVNNGSAAYEFKSTWTGPDVVSSKSWNASASSEDADYYKETAANYYVIYDPVKKQVTTTKQSDGMYDTYYVYVKDGTIRKNGNDYYATSADFGDSTATVTVTGSNDTVTPTAIHSNRGYKIELTAAQVRAGVSVVVTTTVNETNKDKYYVKGFDVNGGITQSIVTQEFDEDGYAIATRDGYEDKNSYDKIYASQPTNSFTYVMPENPEQQIEITPIYFPKCTESNQFVRFYAYDFTEKVKETWGGSLACYPYIENVYDPYGYYPGQLMVCEGGTYYADIPVSFTKTNGDVVKIQGMTMNNYIWDDVHHDLFFNGKSQTDYNYQTYDYNEFAIINDIFADETHDDYKDIGEEDIIFSFKYKENKTYADSNLGQSTYYVDSTDDTKKNGPLDYRTNYKELQMGDDQWQWEDLTDYYNKRVDIFNHRVDVENNEKADYHPILIVSNGYDYNKAGDYATAWAMYVPVDANGDTAFEPNKAVDHYELFDVWGGQGLNTFQSESYLIDPVFYNRVRYKYGAQHSNEGGTDTEGNKISKWIMDCRGIPVKITYEYEISGSKPNDNTLGSKSDYAHRSDGRWYFSSSNQIIKANTIIEYANSKTSPFVRDYYQENGVDYTSGEYEPSFNTGLVTQTKAYCANNNLVTQDNYSHQNIATQTEAYAISDGTYEFSLHAEEDPSGDYTFVGWYRLTEDGTGISYTIASEEMEFTTQAKTNDVFVARYVKTPSGSLTITHNLTSNSTGSATCEAKVEILDNGNPIATQPYQVFTDGVIRVTSKYIKDNSNYTLRITLKNTPEENSIFDKFYNELAGTNELSNDISTFVDTVTTDTVNKTATITTKAIKTLFTDGVQQIKSLPFFSKVDEQLILTHDLLPAIDDTIAETFIKYEIKNSGESTLFFTSDEVKNGPLTVAPEYLYKNTDRRMVVTLRTTIAQNKFHDFDRFSMKLPDGTYYLFKEGQGGLNGENVHIEENHDHTEATITISFPISKLLNNGKLQMNKLQYFSELKTPRFKYSIEYRYDSYVKSYGTQSYTVSGYFDELPGGLAEYTKYSTYYNQQLTFNADATSTSYLKSLASSMAPYEDNFRKTFDFSKASIFSQQYNRGAETYEYKVKTSADNQSFIATMKFPYKVGEYGVPLNSNGQIASSSDIIYAAPAGDLDKTDVTNKEFSVYSGDWIVKSGSRNEKIENYVEPTFIRPALIYQDEEGKNHYFQFWSVKTIGSYGASSLEYTRCYDTSFNLTIFQECEIEPVYSTVAWDTTKMPNPPSTWDMYERFDPDVNRTADNQNGITIRFMENSRNQYNHNGYGSFYNESNVETSKTTEVAERRRGAADRIYTDFLISYNNVEPNTVLKEKYKDGGKKVGIVIEPVGKVSETGGATKTEDQYMTQFGPTVTDEMKSEVSKYLQGKGGTFAKAEFDAKELDNKNRIRYYFGIDNKTAKALNTTILPELDETYSNSHDMIYRAYAYIVDYDESNHTYDWSTLKMNDVPTYYTIYDIGSIQNGGSYPSGN